MKSCAVIPQVKFKDGNIKDSKLFKDLLSITNNNRSLTNRIYYTTKNQQFQSDYSRTLKYDDAEEVTIESLMKVGLSSFIDDIQLIDTIAKEYGFYNEGKPIVYDDTTENYHEQVKKAVDFNTSSRFKDSFTAIVRRDKDRGIYVSVEKADDTTRTEASRMNASYTLNNKIREFLASNGIAIGALNSLDLALGRTGVADFSKAFKEGEGVAELIRIAKGSKGEEVLPEEFAHFIIEGLENETVVQRLVNLMKDRKLAEEVLGEDYKLYASLTDTALAKEAAARFLLDSIYESNNLSSGVWDSLLSRVKSKFKDRFSSMDIDRLVSDIKQARASINGLVTDLPLQKISIERMDRQYSHIDERLDRVKKLLKRLQDQEIKRFHIYRKRSQNTDKNSSEKTAAQRELINIMESKLMSGKFLEGVVFYLQEANSTMHSIAELFEKAESSSISMQDEARYLREIANYIGSYEGTLADIRTTLNEGMLDDEALGPEIKALVNKISENMLRAKTRLDELSFRHFNSFLQKYLPEEGVDIATGDNKKHFGRKELEDLLRHADKDAGFLNIWLYSAANSNDLIIRLADSIIKKKQAEARKETLDIVKEIEAAAQKLRAAGISNEDFMFEKTKDGKFTGRYVSEINWTAFHEAQRDFYKYLEDKYSKNPVDNDAYIKEKSRWYKENLKDDGTPADKYRNKDFLVGARREYWNTFMECRERLLKKLPPYIYREEGKMNDPMRAIQVRKDFVDRMSGTPVQDWWKEIKASLADSLYRRETDTEYGVENAPQDFTGRELMSLPIFFTEYLTDSEGRRDYNSLSHDTVSTMTMFANMVNHYDVMGTVVNSFEIGRNIMENPDRVSQTSKGKPVVSVVKEFGKTVTQSLNKKNSNIATAYNKILDTQVYGRYLESAGSVGKVDIGKGLSLWQKLASLTQIALSPMVAVAAVNQDMANINIEAVAGQYFGMKDLATADKNYFKSLIPVLGEIGSNVKVSKLNLFLEKMDILRDFEQKVSSPYYNKNWFKKLMSSNTLYFLLHMGSHWGQTRVALALANNIRLRDSSGRAITLWDAFDTVYMDPSNPKYGAKLVLKKGLKKEDGTAFTEDDLHDYEHRVVELNHNLFGNYNKADKTALETVPLGSLLLQFRKWIIPAINRRFGKSNYNFMLGTETEGYYLSFGRFLWNCMKDLKEMRFELATHMNELTETERYNIKRALTELTTLLALYLLNTFLFSDWGDEDNPWIQRTTAYLMRRLQTEVGSVTPTPAIFEEFFRIVKSPMAAMSPLEDTLDLTMQLINPWHWGLDIDFLGLDNEENLIQSGKYKDRSKLYRAVTRSMPIWHTIEKTFSPEESLKYFNY